MTITTTNESYTSLRGQQEDAGGRCFNLLAATLSHLELQAQPVMPKHELGTPKYGQLAPPAPLATGDGGVVKYSRTFRISHVME